MMDSSKLQKEKPHTPRLCHSPLLVKWARGMVSGSVKSYMLDYAASSLQQLSCHPLLQLRNLLLCHSSFRINSHLLLHCFLASIFDFLSTMYCSCPTYKPMRVSQCLKPSIQLNFFILPVIGALFLHMRRTTRSMLFGHQTFQHLVPVLECGVPTMPCNLLIVRYTKSP